MKTYRLKKSVGVSEAVEVFKIIKYQQKPGVISEEQYQMFPDLQTYFEEEPSLPQELSKTERE